jgi:hypothetical protein
VMELLYSDTGTEPSNADYLRAIKILEDVSQHHGLSNPVIVAMILSRPCWRCLFGAVFFAH